LQSWSFNTEERSIPSSTSPATASLLAVTAMPVATELVPASLMRIPLLALTLLLVLFLSLEFSLDALLLQLLWGLLDLHLWFRQIQREAGMGTMLASLTLGAEPGQVEGTKLVFLMMLQRASRT
jgi:hypothetical protein